MLPSLRDENTGMGIMDVLSETEQIDVFLSKGINTIVEFKWDSYSFKFHMFFSLIHLCYFVTFVLYINSTYMNRDFKRQFEYLSIMFCCNFVAMVYDLIQLFKNGVSEYMSDSWNYVDLVHVWGGYASLYFQGLLDLGLNDNEKWEEKIHAPKVKIFILIQTLMMMSKTFFFLRTIPILTQFVIMIRKVISDLTNFMLFYMLFVVMCGVLISVLGIRSVSPDDETHDHEDLAHGDITDQISDSN